VRAAAYTRTGRDSALAQHMPFEPKALAPSGSGPEASHSAFEVAAAGGMTVLEAPSGLMHTEGLSSAFTRTGRKPLWLRLSPEDRDPVLSRICLMRPAWLYGPRDARPNRCPGTSSRHMSLPFAGPEMALDAVMPMRHEPKPPAWLPGRSRGEDAGDMPREGRRRVILRTLDSNEAMHWSGT
jgi:hypothetical protein